MPKISLTCRWVQLRSCLCERNNSFDSKVAYFRQQNGNLKLENSLKINVRIRFIDMSIVFETAKIENHMSVEKIKEINIMEWTRATYRLQYLTKYDFSTFACSSSCSSLVWKEMENRVLNGKWNGFLGNVFFEFYWLNRWAWTAFGKTQTYANETAKNAANTKKITNLFILFFNSLVELTINLWLYGWNVRRFYSFNFPNFVSRIFNVTFLRFLRQIPDGNYGLKQHQ